MDDFPGEGASFQDRAILWLTQWDDARLRRLGFTVLGVLTGLLIALFTSIVACSVFFYLFPNYVFLDLADEEQAIELMKTVPANDFIVELAAWVVAVGFGAYAAERIAKRGGYPAWLVGAIFFIFPYPPTRPFEGSGVLATFLTIPHPLWVVLLSVPLVALAAYGAGFGAVMMNANRLNRSVPKPRVRRKSVPKPAPEPVVRSETIDE